jgi:hypothetical protein
MMQRSPFAAAVAAAQLNNLAHHKLNPYQFHAQFNPVALAALSQFNRNPAPSMSQTKRGRPPRRLDMEQNRSRSRSPHSNASTTSGNKSLTTRTSTPSKLEKEEEDELVQSEDELDDLEEDVEIDDISEEEELEDADSDLNTTATSSKSAKKFKKDESSKLTPPPGPVYDFSLQALEMSLYGYLRQTDPTFMGHAISGLRYLVAQQQLQSKLAQEEHNKQGINF